MKSVPQQNVKRAEWNCIPLFPFSFSHVRFCSDDKRIQAYTLLYKSSYERNFVKRIFEKRELSAPVRGSLHSLLTCPIRIAVFKGRWPKIKWRWYGAWIITGLSSYHSNIRPNSQLHLRSLGGGLVNTTGYTKTVFHLSKSCYKMKV
jgi:hypothetical protein